jgi:hypothetical protein
VTERIRALLQELNQALDELEKQQSAPAKIKPPRKTKARNVQRAIVEARRAARKAP